VTKRVIPLALAIVACAPTADDKVALIAEAKLAIAKEIESPASAEFRNVRVAPETGAEIIGTVCGEIRTPHGPDSIPPFLRFIYSKVNDLRAVEQEHSKDPAFRNAPETVAYQREFEGFWNEFCV
jgi:hypothetical protein